MSSFDVNHIRLVKEYLAIKRAKQDLESQNEQSETKSLNQPKKTSQDDSQ